MTAKNYKDISLDNHIGASEVAAIDSKTVVVSSWLGNLSVIDLTSMQIVKQNFVGSAYGCCTLRSLQSHLSVANIHDSTDGYIVEPSCAVATQGGYGVFWNLKDPEAIKIYPHSEATVSSIAFTPANDLIALGIGSYSLSDDICYAYLELWSIESNRFMSKVALPGTCVDAISFSPDGSEIICTTGLRTQDQGFIIRIETASLRLLQIIEIPHIRCHQVRFDNRDCYEDNIYLSSQEGLLAFDLAVKRPLWNIKKDTNFVLGVNEDEERIFLTDGKLADLYDGEVIEKLKMLERCCSVTTLPNDGGYVGISRSGVLRHWQPKITQ